MATTKAQIKTLLESDGTVETKVDQVNEWIDQANQDGYQEGYEAGTEED